MARFFPSSGRLRELISRYGKVALAVHLSVSGLSISGFYVAIKNNVDVEAALQRFGLYGDPQRASELPPPPQPSTDIVLNDLDMAQSNPDPFSPANDPQRPASSKDALISGGGALALAVLCNKFMLPVRVPLTFALTPPIARFLARRNLYKAGS